MEQLLRLPKVMVSVGVAVFEGIRMGKVKGSHCTYFSDCPLNGDCPLPAPQNIPHLAILTPPTPRPTVTDKNLRRCKCQLFEECLVEKVPA